MLKENISSTKVKPTRDEGPSTLSWKDVQSANYVVYAAHRLTRCRLLSPSVCFSTWERGFDVVAHSAPEIKDCIDVLGESKPSGRRFR
jgi:hypothetical protein